MINKLLSLFRNTKFLAFMYQVLTVGFVVFIFYYMISNMFINLDKRGINTGFDFLDSAAGFSIIQTLIEYTEQSSNLRVFFVGITNTLLVSVLSIALASVLGLLIGIGRLSSNWLISKLSLVYIELFRNIPILLQIMFWYIILLQVLPIARESFNFLDYVFLNNRGLYMPSLVYDNNSIFVLIAFIFSVIGVVFLKKWATKRQENTGQTFYTFRASLAILIIVPFVVHLIAGQPISLQLPVLNGFNFEGGLSIIPELMALVLALGIYTATYIAEAVRAGIQAVPKGQLEASLSLGMSEGLTLQKIVLPQALRVIIPPVTTMYLNILKNSSLAVAIGYPEIVTVFAGTTLNVVGQAVEIVLMTMLVYLTISLSISLIMNYMNKKIQLKER